MKSFPKNHLARLLAGIAGAAFAFAAPQAHAQTLLHHWTFDTDGSDSAGSADTTLETGATITAGSAGQFGEALSVPSDPVGAVTADAAAVTLPASDFTYAAWVKPDVSSPDDFGAVMGNQIGAASGAFLRIDDEGTDGDLFGRVNNAAGSLIEGGTVDKDVWTHVAMTVSSTAGLTIYVNGAPAGNNPAGTSHVISTVPFEIGTTPSNPSAQDFWGLIDDVAVYDGVLSAAELNTARIHGAANFAGIGGGVTVDNTASTVEASPAAVPADGSTTSTITVTLRDSNYQGVAGKSVSLAMTAAGPQAATIGTPNPAVTDSLGRAIFTVTSNTAGTEVFEATNDTDALTLTQTDSVEFEPVVGPVDADESTVVASPVAVPADGTTTSTITVTLKDAAGLAVEAEGVTLSGSTGNAAISTPNPATTDANGEATFTVSSSTVETEIFTATSVTDSVVVTLTASVDFQTPPVQELLFYEPFTYTAGDLDGQGGWNATSAQVQTSSFTDDQGTQWDGTITAVPTSGGGFIAQSGAASYDRALDPSITSSFVPGTTTWLSFVAFSGTNGANARWGVAIGAAPLTASGNEMDGQGIGAGQLDQGSGAKAHYWTPNESGSDRLSSGSGAGTGRPVFVMVKIDWAADGFNDTITVARWNQTFATTPSSSDWDAATKVTLTADLDQSTFDTLSVFSSYGYIDEIRIATSFDLAVTGTVVSGGSEYGTWSGGEPFDGDKNGDTVDNGIAFLLGAVGGPDTNALDLLPTATQSGGGLVLNFSCLNAANRGDSQLSVEHSSDLGISDDWVGALVPDVAGESGPVNGVLFNVTLGDPLNSVTATIQPTEAVDGKVFGRLSGTE
jgi:hypothetical protein